MAPLCQLCEETLKISHPPHSWLPPISTQNFSSPHPPITAIFEKSHPPPLPPLPLYERGEVRTINSYAFLLVFKIVESLQ